MRKLQRKLALALGMAVAVTGVAQADGWGFGVSFGDGGARFDAGRGADARYDRSDCGCPTSDCPHRRADRGDDDFGRAAAVTVFFVDGVRAAAPEPEAPFFFPEGGQAFDCDGTTPTAPYVPFHRRALVAKEKALRDAKEADKAAQEARDRAKQALDGKQAELDEARERIEKHERSVRTWEMRDSLFHHGLIQDDPGLPPILPGEKELREKIGRLEGDLAKAEQGLQGANALATRTGAAVADLQGQVDRLHDKADPVHKQEKPFSCGPAAAKMVIASVTGMNFTEEQLRNEGSTLQGGIKYTDKSGMHEAGVDRLLENHGVKSGGGDMTLDELKSHVGPGTPAVIAINNQAGGHFIVVDSVEGEGADATIQVRDPADGGRHTMTGKQLADVSTKGATADGKPQWSAVTTDKTFPKPGM